MKFIASNCIHRWLCLELECASDLGIGQEFREVVD